jgi:flagellin
MQPIGGNNHIASLTAHRHFLRNSREVDSSLEKLATGLRINRGADDPAGLITSENLRAVLAELDAETRALERTNSVANTAEGALHEVSDMLVEANGLVVANASDGLSKEEKQANQMQIDSIISSVNRIAGTASFNGEPLLDGSLTLDADGDSLDVESVAPTSLGTVEIDGIDRTLSDVSSGGALDTVSGDVEGAQQAILAAQNQVSTLRGRIGAFQKYSVDSSINSNRVAFENTAAANSAIRDTDFASETSRLVRSEVLRNSSLRAMVLANGSQRSILSLLA